ncbi:MAG TPA: hypothetical protein VJS68_03360 [Thermoplasmata archaeon]|nr:hypothetical protein [Thermoplasmata archaeon]
MPPKSGSSRGEASRELEELLREMTHDGVAAARWSWRVAHRVGRAGLRWVEKTADAISRELE